MCQDRHAPSRLGPEQRGHVDGGQRDFACVYTGCVEERGSDGRWTNRVRGLGAAAKAFVVARDLHDFDLGHFLHGQNFVAVPIRAGYFSLVESNFHDHPTSSKTLHNSNMNPGPSFSPVAFRSVGPMTSW